MLCYFVAMNFRPLVLLITVAFFIFGSFPLFASDTDARIESAAEATYVFKTYLKDDVIRVDSNDGIVELTGTVAEESHKSMAQEAVRALPGVKRVDNKLVVEANSTDKYSDAWLSLKIKGALLYHHNASAIKTQVIVKDGIATLRGNVPSVEEKQMAERYVQNVKGVKEVHNEMTVNSQAAAQPTQEPAAGPVAQAPAAQPAPQQNETLKDKIDDAAITAQVKVALFTNQSTSGLHTSVNTDGGIVTLGGKAKSLAEKELATRLAQDIKGVVNVVNNMEVEL